MCATRGVCARLAFGESRPGMLPNVIQSTGQPPTTKKKNQVPKAGKPSFQWEEPGSLNDCVDLCQPALHGDGRRKYIFIS